MSFEKTKISLSLLTWGLNEQENIPIFFSKATQILERYVDDYEIIYIDDGSSDLSGELLSALAEADSRIKVHTNNMTMNVGYSCKRAIELATKEYLFWQTLDWSYDISGIETHLKLLNYYDIVQGVRIAPERLLSHIPVLNLIYKAQGRSDNFKKAIVSLVNFYILRLIFGVQLNDFQNITYYRTKQIQSISLKANSAFINPELIIKSYYSGASIIEVPINFIPRKFGDAKGTNLKSIFKAMMDILNAAIHWGILSRFRNNENIKKIDRVSNSTALQPHIQKIVTPILFHFRN